MSSWKEAITNQIKTILSHDTEDIQLPQLIKLMQDEIKKAVIEMHETCKDCEGCRECETHHLLLKEYGIEDDVFRLRQAGCTCPQPLIGYHLVSNGSKKIRCRLCNKEEK